jgi:hypothetical protein
MKLLSSVVLWGVLAKMSTPVAVTALRGSELKVSRPCKRLFSFKLKLSKGLVGIGEASAVLHVLLSTLCLNIEYICILGSGAP